MSSWYRTVGRFQDPAGPAGAALVTRQGLVGRLYDESDLQEEPTASWANPASFWPTLPSQQRQVYAGGYDRFARSAQASGKRKAGQARRAWRRRASS